ncbi:hypothetical protein ZHAS_00021962 [Anopheles sinensis]|uniref:Uncharacterized protein n=1 Tax=Anopheles sinensis TaxID=74873 RepID=A0A084WTB2_ANOSI|nr:hypothetical protein ZHAS_00021962 [Anopheles sinensis]
MWCELIAFTPTVRALGLGADFCLNLRPRKRVPTTLYHVYNPIMVCHESPIRFSILDLARTTMAVNSHLPNLARPVCGGGRACNPP